MYRNIKMSRRLKIQLCFRERSHTLSASVHQDAVYMVNPCNGMVNPCNLWTAAKLLSVQRCPTDNLRMNPSCLTEVTACVFSFGRVWMSTTPERRPVPKAPPQ